MKQADIVMVMLFQVVNERRPYRLSGVESKFWRADLGADSGRESAKYLVNVIATACRTTTSKLNRK